MEPTQQEVEYRRFRADESGIIAQFQADMALETEDKVLNKEEVQIAIDYLHSHPSHGFYLVGAVQSSEEQEPSNSSRAISSEMLTFGHDISRGTDVWWFQSVFVSKAYRGLGVFKRMFTEVEVLNATRKVPLRLYVEVENTRAQQVYQRLGMFDTCEIFVEDDFHFQPNRGNIYESHSDSFAYHLCDAAELLAYKNLRADNRIRSVTGRTYADEKVVAASIDHIIANHDLGGMFGIVDKSTNSIIAYVPVFFEFSDWRNGNMVYNYDLQVVVDAASQEDGIPTQASLTRMIAGYMHHVKNEFKPALRITNIRWMIHESQDAFKQILIGLHLEQAHYRVYEKNTF